LVHEAKPLYTPEAMEAKLQGSVQLDCIVQPSGVCSDIHINKSLDPAGLDQQALRSLREWRFKPGTRRGKAVPVFVNIEVAFTLR
jgi:TonB family protein